MMTAHASKENRELDYLGDLSFEAGQVSIEMTDEQAAEHGVSAVRIARLASLIIAMDDKKLEGLLRGAGESDSATAMFRRLADSFANEANLLEKGATMMNDACGRLVVVMDRISIEDAEAAAAAEAETETNDGDDAPSDAVAPSIEEQIVVEIDRGLRSADRAGSETTVNRASAAAGDPKTA